MSQRLREASIPIGNERLWKKAEAIEVAEWLEAAGRRIYGVEPFFVRDDGVYPVTFSWREDNAGRDDGRFPASPAEFIRRFSWEIIPLDEKSEPYFCFTTD